MASEPNPDASLLDAVLWRKRKRFAANQSGLKNPTAQSNNIPESKLQLIH
jgi:hypothetical protein